jgi:hypothetical protein
MQISFHLGKKLDKSGASGGQISLKNFYWLPQIIALLCRQGNWTFFLLAFIHI